jgi:hypothetical protein
MDVHTIHEANSPGWRELVEGLYAHIEAAREWAAVLQGLWRRGRLARVGLWYYAPPTRHNETGQPAEEMPL